MAEVLKVMHDSERGDLMSSLASVRDIDGTSTVCSAASKLIKQPQVFTQLFVVSPKANDII